VAKNTRALMEVSRGFPGVYRWNRVWKVLGAGSVISARGVDDGSVLNWRVSS